MEALQTIQEVKTPISIADALPEVISQVEVVSTSKPFIEANTIPAILSTIKQEHIIPVFLKDNEPVISHAEFIERTLEAVHKIYSNETILSPNIRLSHPIKGRIPEAKHKAAKDLLDHERTVYYERMAFIIEIPSITTLVNGNELALSIGGVKSYNLDNLNARTGAPQHFKLFVGFQNKVCTNLCVSSDGLVDNLKVANINQLYSGVLGLLEGYNAVEHSNHLQAFGEYNLSEEAFAKFIGRCKLYRFLPDTLKKQIPELHLADSQINMICKDYYDDPNFRCNEDGSISLWNLYNLLTNSNKLAYIDSFLRRSERAYNLTRELQIALQNNDDCWFLN